MAGLQGGNTKYCCFLCEWDSQARDRHCHGKQWPFRGETILGHKNVTYRALVDKTNKYLPQIHIKLGLIKTFVKAMNKEGEGFDHLRQKFPRIMEAKMIKKDGLNFVRLYFLNYTRYVNDLHNI